MATITTKADNKVITAMTKAENNIVRRINAFRRKETLSVSKSLANDLKNYKNKKGEELKSFNKTSLKDYLQTKGMYNAETGKVTYITIDKEGGYKVNEKAFEANWNIKLAYLMIFEASKVEEGKVLSVAMIEAIMNKAEEEAK